MSKRGSVTFLKEDERVLNPVFKPAHQRSLSDSIIKIGGFSGSMPLDGKKQEEQIVSSFLSRKPKKHIVGTKLVENTGFFRDIVSSIDYLKTSEEKGKNYQQYLKGSGMLEEQKSQINKELVDLHEQLLKKVQDCQKISHELKDSGDFASFNSNIARLPFLKATRQNIIELGDAEKDIKFPYAIDDLLLLKEIFPVRDMPDRYQLNKKSKELSTKDDAQNQLDKSFVELQIAIKKLDKAAKEACIKHNMTELLTELIKGEDVDWADKHEDTLLYLATELNKDEIIDMLLENGADSLKMSGFKPPISKAIENLNTHLITKFLNKKYIDLLKENINPGFDISQLLDRTIDARMFYQELAKIFKTQEDDIENGDDSKLGFKENSFDSCVVSLSDTYTRELGGTDLDLWDIYDK